MSQEPPQPQEPQPPSEPAKPQVKSSTIRQKLAQVWQTAQPVLVQLSIGLLGTIIPVLQSAQTKLEGAATELPPPDARVENILTRLRSLLTRLWELWKGLLQGVRSRLPQSWQQKLQGWSEPALTSAIAGIVLLVLWTTSALNPEPVPPPKIAARPSVPAIKAPAPIKPVPSVQPTLKPTPPVKPAVKPELPKGESSPIADLPVQPPVVPAPKPTPVASPSPKPAPSPQPKAAPSPPPAVVKLTPEQALIADVQSQVSGIADRYSQGLSQSVQPNFVGSRLRLQLADDWYDLKPAQQDDLAQEVWQRSRALDFSRLEILDRQQHLLARNPVVGDQVIILQRQPL